ncbi:cupredoxin family protein [Achromobacter xylosoxidans]
MKGNLLRTSQAAACAALLAIGLALPAHAARRTRRRSWRPRHAAAAASIGKPGDPARATRTVNVDMDDSMRFTPDRIEVKAGETVRLNVRNAGKIRHELVLGTDADLKAHYDMMMKDPGMRHEEANSISLDAGKSGQIVWRFDKAGTVSFGCLEPGHYAAGMKGSVTVM